MTLIVATRAEGGLVDKRFGCAADPQSLVVFFFMAPVGDNTWPLSNNLPVREQKVLSKFH